MSNPVRVRFAPSPTGFLHIGGARTALFNWLYARARGGQFVLRIEDTDTARSEPRFIEDIMESLRWLGMDWDEEPIYQSARFEQYLQVARELVSTGHAYYCECSPEQLDVIRKACVERKVPFRYPGTCRNKGLGPDGNVVRLKVPTEGETPFDDLIRGRITIRHSDLDDWVMLRANQTPTYNFTNVIDDRFQGITHVLRGEDHINNTPKQILLYQTLGSTPPLFAHLPMILGSDRAKLSKRHGAASTLEYRAQGFLPAALTCFLVRLGWSHGDQEIFTLQELQSLFNIEHVGRANAVFSQEKLNWVGGKMMELQSPEYLYDYLGQYFSESIPFLADTPPAVAQSGIAAIQSKVKNVLDLIEQLGCLFGPDPSYLLDTLKADQRPQAQGILRSALAELEQSDFSTDDLEKRLKGLATQLKIKFTPVAQAVRFAVTGGRVSPGLFDMLHLQGKLRVVRRVQAALEVLK